MGRAKRRIEFDFIHYKLKNPINMNIPWIFNSFNLFSNLGVRFNGAVGFISRFLGLHVALGPKFAFKRTERDNQNK